MKFLYEGTLDLCPRNSSANLWSIQDQIMKIEIFFPCAHGVTLYQPVGVFARDSALNQVEQQLSAKDQPACAREVGEHTFRIDEHCVKQGRGFIQQIIGKGSRVGNDDALRRRV